MTTQPQPGHVSLDSSTQPARVRAIGDWTLAHYTALEREVTRLRSEVAGNASFDLSQLGALDTAGAALLAELLGAERLADLAELEPSLPRERQALLKTVGHALHDFCEPENQAADHRHRTAGSHRLCHGPSGCTSRHSSASSA